jgi:hypothetical protein
LSHDAILTNHVASFNAELEQKRFANVHVPLVWVHAKHVIVSSALY